MKSNFTYEEFCEYVRTNTPEDVVGFLVENYELEFKPFPKPPLGVYRREMGLDLIVYDYYDKDPYGVFIGENECRKTDIIWSCYNEKDWWVQVLNKAYQPVLNGYRIQFDSIGNRTA